MQERLLNIAFRVADEHGLLIDDLTDLRSFLTFLTLPQGAEWATQYGRVSKPTVDTIQRQILVLENQSGTNLFSLPTIRLDDFMHTDNDGRGRINILAADKLIQSPRLYATLLLWLLSQLFQKLPEVGDRPKPKLVFFFDEAHLLFTDAPKTLLDKIEQVVRLIQFKGVGVYFVTQYPLDIPDIVLGQLGNRVQHALRVFTPRDHKAVKAAAEIFQPKPAFDTAKVIMELGKGEALVSFLDEDGVPTPVERVKIRPPTARVGSITREERKALIDASPIKGKYEQSIDRERAFQTLAAAGLVSGRGPASDVTAGLVSRQDPASAVTIRGGLGSSGGLFALIAKLTGIKTFRGNKSERDKASRHIFDLIARGIPVKIICGELPSISLSTGEEIRCVIPGTTLSEARAVRTWRSVYGGPSIRIAKGLSFRYGQSAGVSESHDELRRLDMGTLVVTTLRLIFTGSQRTISIALPKIIEMRPYADALQVHRQDKEKAELFLFNDNLTVNLPDANGKTIFAPLNGGLLKAVISQAIGAQIADTPAG